MPFNSTRVAHPGWAGRHRPVAEATHTATCTITTGGATGWDPATGPTTTTEPTVLYVGTCRVQALNASPDDADAAGQATVEHPYRVGIASDAADIPVGARVTVGTCPDDARLVGKVLTVADVRYGSLRWERVLLCDLDLTNQPTGEA